MGRRLGALIVVLVAAAAVVAARPSEPAPQPAAPERIEAPRQAGPPRSPAPDIACPYPAGRPREPGGCAPRRDGPVTPGGVPARPWLTRG